MPAGIADGQRVRIAGRGHAGSAGAAPGDLYVLIRVREDERFVREGDDLITVLDVPATLAALGASLEVPTLGEPIAVEVAAGTQPGEVITLRGHGMPRLQRHGHGDLRVVVNVQIPRRLSDEQRDAARAAERDDHRREPAGRRIDLQPAASRAAPPPPAMIRLAVRVARADAADALAELLVFSPAGVEELDGDADAIEYVLYGAPGELPSLRGAARRASGGRCVDVSASEIADDWASRWRTFHHPVEIAGRLNVRPPWHARPPATEA